MLSMKTQSPTRAQRDLLINILTERNQQLSDDIADAYNCGLSRKEVRDTHTCMLNVGLILEQVCGEVGAAKRWADEWPEAELQERMNTLDS